MPKHKSISQRLRSAKSPEAKLKTLQAWTRSWDDEQFYLIEQIEKAIKFDDYDLLCSSVGQLKVVSEKKFEALPKIFEKLIESES